MENRTKVDVMFRVDTSKEFKGTVFAILPYEIATLNGDVTIYQHVGQHSQGDYNACISFSRLASKIESNELRKEMESIGYNINLVSKRNHSKYINALNSLRDARRN
jgi:hypothetical protein